MTIPQLLARRDRTTPASVLAQDPLNAMRYEALRGMSPKQFAAIYRSAILTDEPDEDFDAAFEAAFDALVDKLVLTGHAQTKEQAL